MKRFGKINPTMALNILYFKNMHGINQSMKKKLFQTKNGEMIVG